MHAKVPWVGDRRRFIDASVFEIQPSDRVRSPGMTAPVALRLSLIGPFLMLPTNNGQSDQALVDASKASGARYLMVEWRRWRL